MSVIDFRVRPLYKAIGAAFPEAGVRWFFDAFGYEVKGAAKERSMEALIKELKEANVTKAVLAGRVLPGFTNELMLECAGFAPDIFVPFPFLDVADPRKSLEDIDTYIIDGKRLGASMEPSKIDDPALFPIYAKLEERHIPVMATISGLVGQYADHTLPHQIDVVLSEFPQLKFVAAHAGWPWLTDMIVVAFRHPNLYLTADFEGTRGAGADLLRQAAVHMLKNQVIFASSFPCGPIADGVQSVRDWNLPKDVEQKVFYDNAAGILGI